MRPPANPHAAAGATAPPPQAPGPTLDPRGAADGAHRVRQVGARDGARGALPGRDRERRLRAGLSRDGYRDRETRRRGARAGAASPDRRHRSGRGLFGGTLSRRRDSCDRRHPIARRRSAARRRDDALLQGAAGGTFGVAGRRSGRARAPGRPCGGGRLARAARRARAHRSGDGRAPRAHGRAAHPARARGLRNRGPAAVRTAGRAGGRRPAGQDDRRGPRAGGPLGIASGDRRPVRRHARCRSRGRGRRAARAPSADARHALDALRGLPAGVGVPRRQNRCRDACARKASRRRGNSPSASSRGFAGCRRAHSSLRRRRLPMPSRTSCRARDFPAPDSRLLLCNNPRFTIVAGG